jgi:ADP-ribosyl-[dinitrogen reductase] hydrolase
MSTVLRDRIAGSLYGLVVGDALGCPVEGWTAPQIVHVFGRLTEMEIPHGRWQIHGLHTDDGQQALALCDAILADPAHPGIGFARWAVEMLQADPFRATGLHRGAGSNFLRTVTALAQGTPWDQAATISAGNGAAMRIAPVALYHRNNWQKLLESVVDVSQVTHRDIRGVAAAGAVAYLVARALTHHGPACALGDDSLLAFIHAIENTCANRFSTTAHQHDFSQAVGHILPMLDRELAAILSAITMLAQTGTFPPAGATDGFALGSVLTAIVMFLRSQDFEQTLIETVMLGGDTDTTGAMVGQMCGALYGKAAIPLRWLQALVACGALEDRIDALLEQRAGFRPAVSAIALEQQWTRDI